MQNAARVVVFGNGRHFGGVGTLFIGKRSDAARCAAVDLPSCGGLFCAVCSGICFSHHCFASACVRRGASLGLHPACAWRAARRSARSNIHGEGSVPHSHAPTGSAREILPCVRIRHPSPRCETHPHAPPPTAKLCHGVTSAAHVRQIPTALANAAKKVTNCVAMRVLVRGSAPVRREGGEGVNDACRIRVFCVLSRHFCL